jgi:DNA-binding transcriptional LysR family regulator
MLRMLIWLIIKKNTQSINSLFNNHEQMDKLSAMATFVAVVDAGSFTRASEALTLPKARVSQRISDLEANLGVRLLQRSTRALSLTKDGEVYLERCRQILLDITEVEDVLKGSQSTPTGSIHVDVLSSIARWVIAPKMPEFQTLYPNLAVRLGSSDRVSNLLEEGIDCAIRGGSLEDSAMVAKHLADVTIGLYACPTYLQSAMPPAEPEDMLSHRRMTWFSPRGGGRLTWQLENEERNVSLPSAELLQFEDPDVAIAACLAGAGICPAAPFAVESYVRAGLLVPVLPRWHFKPRPIHIIYPTRKHLSSKVRCFVEWSSKLIRENEALHLTPMALAQKFQ